MKIDNYFETWNIFYEIFFMRKREDYFVYAIPIEPKTDTIFKRTGRWKTILSFDFQESIEIFNFFILIRFQISIWYQSQITIL